METKYINSRDGARIAYNVTGRGPALLLVHGGIGDYSKELWYETKWVDRLKDTFTLIIPDLRGNGESDKSIDPAFYDINNIINDLNTILRECDISSYSYFGWSYGATIGFQMCKTNSNILKAVCAGSIMGPSFSKIFSPSTKAIYEEVNNNKKLGRLDEMNLSTEERSWVEAADLDLRIAQLTAWQSWPVISPSDIKPKLAIYSGTNDTSEIVNTLNAQIQEMTKSGIVCKIFDGLNHFGLIKELDVVYPWVIDFLI